MTGSAAEKSALTEAVELNDTRAMEELLYADMDVNEKDDKGRTMLMLAAHLGHVEAALLLLDNGSDPNQKGELGVTPLMAAAHMGQLEMVCMLVNLGVEINATNEINWTALMYAANCRDGAGIVRVLLDKGADVTAADNRNGGTALSFAESSSHEESVRLLKEAKASQACKDNEAQMYQYHATARQRQERLNGRVSKPVIARSLQP